MQTEKKPASKELQVNNSLSTLFVDGAFVTHRRDGASLIRLVAGLPEGNSEQARIMISDEHLHRIIDVLCRSINYYPKKSSDIKKKATKNK